MSVTKPPFSLVTPPSLSRWGRTVWWGLESLRSCNRANLPKVCPGISYIQLKDKLKEAKKPDSAMSLTKPPSGLATVEGAPDVSLASGMSEEERKQRVCLMISFNYLQSFIVNFTGDQTLYPRQPPLLQCQHRCETIYGQRDNQRVLRIELCCLVTWMKVLRRRRTM